MLLAPDANDWRLYAAQQVLRAGGADGAERIIGMVPADSIYAPDAEIIRAEIELERRNDDAAMAAAERAFAQAGGRWSIISSVGDVYRRAGHPDRAIPAFDRALAMVTDPEDRADVLGWRAYAHRFAGNLRAASADMRAALELDQSVDTRLLYVSILMDDPQGRARATWRAGCSRSSRLGAAPQRAGLCADPASEGLGEGYRLWRGFNGGQQDYAVVDSLSRAYYLTTISTGARADQRSTISPRTIEGNPRSPGRRTGASPSRRRARVARRARSASGRGAPPRTRTAAARPHAGAAPARTARVSLPEGPAQQDELDAALGAALAAARARRVRDPRASRASPRPPTI